MLTVRKYSSQLMYQQAWKGSQLIRAWKGLLFITEHLLFSVTEVSVDRDRFVWVVNDESVQVTVLDDGQPLLEDKNITITLIRSGGGFSTDLIVTEAIIALCALPPVPGLIFPSKCITSSLLPYPSVST